jgi:ATP-dependent RNA helicase DDX24/MAK5
LRSLIVSEEATDAAPPAAPKKAKKAKKAKKTAVLGGNYETVVQQPASAVPDSSQVDMSAWNNMGLHPTVIDALAKLGFTEPTPIQLQTVPLAIVQRRDVIGAAETGSGKTLSFGLPIISNIVTERGVRASRPTAAESAADKLEALVLVPTRELAIQVSAHLRAVAQPCGIGVATIVGGMSVQKQQRLLKRHPAILVATPGRFLQLLDDETGDPYLCDLSGLRYFALDEADRMVEKAHFDDLHKILLKFPVFEEPKSKKRLEEAAAVAAAAAAAAAQKKANKAAFLERNAKKKPRRGEEVLTHDGGVDDDNGDDDDNDDDDDDDDDNSNQEKSDDDEADALGDADDDGMEMTVQEHGEDGDDDDDAAAATEAPTEILDPDLPDVRVKTTRRRQTFIFSATLGAAVADALANSSHIRSLRQKRGLSAEVKTKPTGNALIDAVAAENDARTAQLLGALEFQGAKAPAVVDLTNSRLTVQQLREYRVECTLESKDMFLYAFLDQHRGRTLVFVNAISAIRRLLPLLELLKVPVWSLHADKQQRQRLKVLERFRAAPYGVLVATDVAARGLDIPNVDQVVHFQVPRTIELYVHRTGRTARAQRAGVSLMMVSPEDRDNFIKLLRLPGKDAASFEQMQFDPQKMQTIERRVDVARKLEVAMHTRKKDLLKQQARKQAAALQDAGVGDDSDDDGEEAMARAAQRRHLERELKHAELAQSGAAVPAPAAPKSRKLKRKNERLRPHSGVTTDKDGELVRLGDDSYQVRLPQLRGELDELMKPSKPKSRRTGFLPIDDFVVQNMTGSRPDALVTPMDDALSRALHPTASFADKKWATKSFFNAVRDPAEVERLKLRRLGKQKAVAERRAAKKAKFESSKVKRHGAAPADSDDDDDS